MPANSSTISSSATRLACSLSVGALSSCGVFLSSITGVCSRGITAPGSMTRSDTRHLFCLVDSVSSSASPCVGLSMIVVGLGVRDQSCTSSVSHSMYLSKSPAVIGFPSVYTPLLAPLGVIGWPLGLLVLRTGWGKSFLSRLQIATLPQ